MVGTDAVGHQRGRHVHTMGELELLEGVRIRLIRHKNFPDRRKALCLEGAKLEWAVAGGWRL
jgi:hypothetical protein